MLILGSRQRSSIISLLPSPGLWNHRPEAWHCQQAQPATTCRHRASSQAGTKIVSINSSLNSRRQHAMQQCGPSIPSAGTLEGSAWQQLQQAGSLTPGSRCSLGCLAMKDRVAAASWTELAWRSMLCRRSGAVCWELPSASLLVVDNLSGTPAMGSHHAKSCDTPFMGLSHLEPPCTRMLDITEPLCWEPASAAGGSLPFWEVCTTLVGCPTCFGRRANTSHLQPVGRSCSTCSA